MATNITKKVQFLRNTDTIYTTRDAAKTAMLNIVTGTSASDIVDGQAILGRYSVSGVVETVFGIVHKDVDSKTGITYYEDADLFWSAINSLNTNKADKGTISYNGSVSGTASNSGNITIGHKTKFSTTGQTSPNAAQTPGYNSTFNIPVIQYDAEGHITSATTTTVKIPASDNTDAKVAQASATTGNHYMIVKNNATNDKPTTGVQYVTAVTVADDGSMSAKTLVASSEVTAPSISGTTVKGNTVSGANITASTEVKAPTISGAIITASTEVKAPTISGTTVKGDNITAGTLFATTLSATTISATTYANLPSAPNCFKTIGGISATTTADTLTVTGEKGISAATAASKTLKIGHSTSMTAGTVAGASGTSTSYGGTFTMPTVTVDAYGHVTGSGTTTVKMPSAQNLFATIGDVTATGASTTLAVEGTNGVTISANNTSKTIQVKGVNATTTATGVVKLASTTGTATGNTVMTQSAATVTVSADSTNYKYDIYQGGHQVGSLDIPKDTVVKSGTTITATGNEKNGTDASATNAGLTANHKYIKLELANADTKNNLIYVDTESLVDVYSGYSGTIVTTTVNGYTISATVKDGSISATQLAANAVTSGKIANGAVTEAKIGAGAVTSGKVATNAIATANIQDSAVTSGKLADSAVVADKIASGAVTEAKIGAGAVTSAKVATNAIATSNIQNSAVSVAKIASKAVTKAKLADDVVVSADTCLSVTNAGKLNAGVTISHNTATTAGSNSVGAQTLAWGQSVNIPNVTYDTYGHITASGSTTLTMPSAPSFSDTKVTETLKSDNVEYRLLATPSAMTTTQTTTAVFNTGMTMNPSTGIISATAYKASATSVNTGNANFNPVASILLANGTVTDTIDCGTY